MQVNEYDFKRINLRMKELDLRLVKLEHEISEFKSWLEARFPRQANVESNSTNQLEIAKMRRNSETTNENKAT